MGAKGKLASVKKGPGSERLVCNEGTYSPTLSLAKLVVAMLLVGWAVPVPPPAVTDTDSCQACQLPASPLPFLQGYVVQTLLADLSTALLSWQLQRASPSSGFTGNGSGAPDLHSSPIAVDLEEGGGYRYSRSLGGGCTSVVIGSSTGQLP